MSVSFARQTKLSNVSGRSNYISNPSRQDNIVLHSTEHMQNSWNDYAKYERENTKSYAENNQGREIIIHLPHELSKDKDKLKKVVDDYSKKVLGNNRDFEYAVHWNQKESNLHAHIIFSERERNIEREPKIYKRDMWYDKDTNRMTKANAENSELRFKKGDFQRDKETGEIKYNDDPFTIKDKRFKTLRFNEEIKEIHKEVMNEHGFNFRLFDPEKEVAQKHIGNKGEHQPEIFIHEDKETGEIVEKKNPYVLQAKENKEFNENVKGLNAYLEKMKMTVQEYMDKFKKLFNHVKDSPTIESRLEEMKSELEKLEQEKSVLEQELRKHEKICIPYLREERNLKELEEMENNIKNKKIGMLDFKGQNQQKTDLEKVRNNIEKLETELKDKNPEYMKARTMRDDINQELKMIDSQRKNLLGDIKDYAKTNNLEIDTKEIAKGYNKGFNKGDLEQYQENADRKLAEQQKQERLKGRSR